MAGSAAACCCQLVCWVGGCCAPTSPSLRWMALQNAFPGRMKVPRAPAASPFPCMPRLYRLCPAAPSVALPYLTKGDTFDSQACIASQMHALFGKRRIFILLWFGGQCSYWDKCKKSWRTVGRESSGRKKQKAGVGAGRGPAGPVEE